MYLLQKKKKMSIQGFNSFFDWVALFLIELYERFIYFGYQIPSVILPENMFSNSIGFLFTFWLVSFAVQNILNLISLPFPLLLFISHSDSWLLITGE